MASTCLVSQGLATLEITKTQSVLLNSAGMCKPSALAASEEKTLFNVGAGIMPSPSVEPLSVSSVRNPPNQI